MAFDPTASALNLRTGHEDFNPAHAANDQKKENTVNKTTNPLPISAVKEADNANAVQEDLDEQQESLRKEAAGPAAAAAAAAGVAAFKRPSAGSDG